MRSNTHPRYDSPREDREIFVRDNAVYIVDDLEAKIVRQRKELTRLNKGVIARKRLIRERDNLIGLLRSELSIRSDRIDQMENLSVGLLVGLLASFVFIIISFAVWVISLHP